MIKYFIIFIFCLSNLNVFCYNKTADSLIKIFNSNSHDTIRLKAVNELLSYLPSSEAEFYNDKMIELAEAMINSNQQLLNFRRRFLVIATEGYYYKGVFLANRNLPDSALIYFDKCIRSQLGKEGEVIIANSCVSKAIIFSARGIYKEAVDLLYKSLKYFETKKDYEGAAYAYIHLGKLFQTQKMFNTSNEYFDKAYFNYKKTNNAYGMSDALTKMARVYHETGNYKKSLDCLNRSVKLSIGIETEDLNDNEQLLLSNLAFLAFKNNQIDSSIYYFEKFILSAKKRHKTYLLSSGYLNLAESYFHKKQYIPSLTFALKSLTISKENKDVSDQKNTSFFLAKYYKTLNNYKLAFQFQEMYMNLNDSLIRAENKRKVIEEKMKYEFEKKQMLINSNSQIAFNKLKYEMESKSQSKNMWLVILAAGLIIISILGYYLYKNQLHKNVIEVQNSNILRQRIMLSRMNPHFIFNSINSIQSFILDKKEKEAYSYLAKFSRLIRMVLNNTEELYVPLFQEIDLLKTYVELEQLRFDNVFSFEMVIDANVSEQTLYIPPMLIQPYVENAIWHGLMNLKSERPGKLKVEIDILNDLLRVQIIDNGVGRTVTQSFKKLVGHEPVAMKLTEKRLELINNAWKKIGVRVGVENLYNQKMHITGTKVEMFLPLDYQENGRG